MFGRGKGKGERTGSLFIKLGFIGILFWGCGLDGAGWQFCLLMVMVSIVVMMIGYREEKNMKARIRKDEEIQASYRRSQNDTFEKWLLTGSMDDIQRRQEISASDTKRCPGCQRCHDL